MREAVTTLIAMGFKLTLFVIAVQFIYLANNN